MLLFFILTFLATVADGLHYHGCIVERRKALEQSFGYVLLGLSAETLPPNIANAAAPKMSDSELAKIVTEDVTERQFLATADFTRSLYDESATFTDEIDTYTMDKFVIGTKKLFDANRSHVDLTSPVIVDATQAAFTFKETLCFNIPLLHPVVSLSGKVILKRDPDTGLFISYREFWDQSPSSVIFSARF